MNIFIGLSNERPILDIVSSSINQQHPNDPEAIFLPTSYDFSTSNLFDESNLVMTPLKGEVTKIFSSNNKASRLKEVSGELKSFNLSQNEKANIFDNKAASDPSQASEDGNKRGKYKTYTEDEKAQIVSFMLKNGIEKTLEAFSGETHKLTKRKLKSWVEGLDKVKGIKGRKSSDPARDQALNKWCINFQLEQGRPPSRKEATKKALELNTDPNFSASKGWLDKFSRKYKIEFTPLKVIPPRGPKKIKTDKDTKSSIHNLQLLPSLIEKKDHEIEEDIIENRFHLANNEELDSQEGKVNTPTLNSLFNTNNHQPLQQQANQHGGMPLMNFEASLDSDLYQNVPSLEMEHLQNLSYSIFNNMDSFPYQGFSYLKGYPVNCRQPYPISFQPNIGVNYQTGMQDNLKQFQKLFQQDNMKVDNL